MTTIPPRPSPRPRVKVRFGQTSMGSETTPGQRLVLAGVTLFITAMIGGFVGQFLPEPEILLFAFLEMALNGSLLLLLGLVWSDFRLGRAAKFSAQTIIYVSYAKLLFILSMLAGWIGVGEPAETPLPELVSTITVSSLVCTAGIMAVLALLAMVRYLQARFC